MTSSTSPGPFADLDEFLALPRVAGLAVSTDGSRAVTAISELNEKRTEYVTAVWELDVAGEQPARRLTRGAKGESAPVFTASGDLLFIAKRDVQGADGTRRADGLAVAAARGRRGGRRHPRTARRSRRRSIRPAQPTSRWSPRRCCRRPPTSRTTGGCARCARTPRSRRCCTPAIRCGTGITTSVPPSRTCSTLAGAARSDARPRAGPARRRTSTSARTVGSS